MIAEFADQPDARVVAGNPIRQDALNLRQRGAACRQVDRYRFGRVAAVKSVVLNATPSVKLINALAAPLERLSTLFAPVAPPPKFPGRASVFPNHPSPEGVLSEPALPEFTEAALPVLYSEFSAVLKK